MPTSGRAPSTENRLAVADVTRIRSGSPAPVSVTSRVDQAASSEIVEASSRQARYAALLTRPKRAALPPRVSVRTTARSAPGQGSGRASTP